MPATTLHVIDATAALFRAYFAWTKIRAPGGQEVGGVFGLCQSLVRFLRVVRPTHVALVFDSGEPTFRHVAYPAYKADRGAPPDDLIPQFDFAIRASRAMGFLGYRIPGYEADDLMATIAHRGTRAGLRTVLVTPDKDVHQLIDRSVLVMDPKSLALVDESAVEERFGVPPRLLPDLLAIAGDPSDNIPGVPGIGPKGACALARAFGGLDGIYANLDRIAGLGFRGCGAMAAKLAAHREQAFLYRTLVELRRDAPLSEEAMTIGMLRYLGPGSDADPILEELGLSAPLRALRSLMGRG